MSFELPWNPDDKYCGLFIFPFLGAACKPLKNYCQEPTVTDIWLLFSISSLCKYLENTMYKLKINGPDDHNHALYDKCWWSNVNIDSREEAVFSLDLDTLVLGPTKALRDACTAHSSHIRDICCSLIDFSAAAEHPAQVWAELLGQVQYRYCCPLIAHKMELNTASHKTLKHTLMQSSKHNQTKGNV